MDVMDIFSNITKSKTIVVLSVLAVMLIYPFATVSAQLSDEQRRAFELGAGHYDHEIIDANTGDGGGTQTGTLEGACYAEQIWNYLLDKKVHGVKLTPHLVAGIMGNMQAESAFYPNRVQGQEPENGSDDADISAGYGIVQWTPGRKIIPPFDRLKSEFANEDTPVTKHSDLRFQLTLLLEQLNGTGSVADPEYLPEGPAGQDLVQYKNDTRGAAKSFMTKFERPKDQSAKAQNDRADLADGVFNTGTSGQWNCEESQQ